MGSRLRKGEVRLPLRPRHRGRWRATRWAGARSPPAPWLSPPARLHAETSGCPKHASSAPPRGKRGVVMIDLAPEIAVALDGLTPAACVDLLIALSSHEEVRAER